MIYLRRVLSFVLVALLAVLAADAQRSTGIKKEQRRNKQQITQAQRNIKQNAAAVESNLRSLELLEGEITDITAEVRRLRGSSDSLYRLIKPLNDSIKELDGNLSTMRAKYAGALRKSQTNGRAMNDLTFILSSESFMQAWQRYRSLRQFSRWRQRRSAEIIDTRRDVLERRERLDSLKNQNTRVLAKVESRRNTLEKKRVETDRLVKSLKNQSRQLEQILKKRQEEAARLEERLEKAIAEEIQLQQEKERKEKERLEKERIEKERLEREKREQEQAAQAKAEKDKNDTQATPVTKTPKTETNKTENKPAETAKPTQPTKTTEPAKTEESAKTAETSKTRMEALTGDFESNRGRLPFPVKGQATIVKKFGRQKHPRLPKVETNNPGIDIEASKGASVHAVFDGEVSQIFKLAGYNNVIVLRHGDYVTVYANIASLDVKKGDKVKTGQQLGRLYVDQADNDRSVLHFELRREKDKKDPEMWLRR